MVIGIGAEESQASCLSWINTHNLQYMVLADPTRVVWNNFTMGYIPHNVVLDCNNTILYTNYGYYESTIRQHANTALASVIGVVHEPLSDTENTSDPILFEASFNSTSFQSGYPVLAWRVASSGLFNQIPMEHMRWESYLAQIPAQADGTYIEYYLDIRSAAGCNRIYPPGAPQHDIFTFYVGTDIFPPVITHTPRAQIGISQLPLEISADVTDNLDIATVDLEYRINGGEIRFQAMSHRNGYMTFIDDSLEIDDVVEYRIHATDTAQNPNEAILPESGYFSSTVVDQIPALVADLTSSYGSGPQLAADITAIAGSSEYVTELPADLSPYASVFVCLGVYGEGNHQLTSAEGSILASYLSNGGRVYMEGGDTFYYDPETTVHSYFHITASSDGTNDAGPINGVTGSFTEGMNMGYSPAASYNNWIDHLVAGSSARVILQNGTPSYDVAISYESGTYKTVGSSVLYGGLSRSGSSPDEFLAELLNFFDVGGEPATPTPTPTATNTPPATNTPTPTATPSPTEPPPTMTPTMPCVNTGDVDNNDSITPEDALKAFQIYLAIIPDPSEGEYCRADCNGTSTVTPEDALCIFLHYLSGECQCADPLLSMKRGAAPQNPIQNVDQSILSISVNIHRDNTATISGYFEGSTKSFDAFGLRLNLPEVINVLGVTAGDLASSWEVFGANQKGSELTIGGFEPVNAVDAGTDGGLFKIECSLKHAVSAGQILNAMEVYELSDDIASSEVVLHTSRTLMD